MTLIKGCITYESSKTIFGEFSGSGLNVYIHLNITKRIENHSEHAAIARAVLAKISAQTGLELEAKVDTLGGNMSAKD